MNNVEVYIHCDIYKQFGNAQTLTFTQRKNMPLKVVINIDKLTINETVIRIASKSWNVEKEAYDMFLEKLPVYQDKSATWDVWLKLYNEYSRVS